MFSQPMLNALRASLREAKGPQAEPCDGCRQFERCRAERICCDAFALFARLGSDHSSERWRLAPRQPSVAILERLQTVRRSPSISR